MIPYLQRDEKKEEAEVALNLRNSSKRNSTSSQILQQENHVGENLHAVQIQLSVHVGRSSGLHAAVVGPHVAEPLASVPDRDVQSPVLHGVHVGVPDPESQQHGDVDGNVRRGVDVDSGEAHPDDLQVGIRRPQDEGGGGEEDETEGGDRAEMAAAGGIVNGKNDAVLEVGR